MLPWHASCDVVRMDDQLLRSATELGPNRFIPEQDAPEAIVCIPTFRRPEGLAHTLSSLLGQVNAPRFAVVIVDNDAKNREGLAVARQYLVPGILFGMCVTEERQGNCHAINRAFTVARESFPKASYFLMIDDDEIADPNWLANMVRAAKANRADIVGGPVVPEFSRAVNKARKAHPVYNPAYNRSGTVAMIYGSGNCLIHRSVFERLAEPNFDIRFNFLGGGDMHFFTRCRDLGLSFFWAHEARIRETVPAERLTTKWIIWRGLRIGAINYRVDAGRQSSIAGWSKVALKNCGLLPLSLMRAACMLARRTPALVALHPIFVAAGRILAWGGFEPQPYKAEA